MTKNIYIYNPDFKRDLRYDYDCSRNTSLSQKMNAKPPPDLFNGQSRS